MAGITQAQAQAQLDTWLAASTTVATNQAYTIAGRSFTRADAKEIRENIQFWDKMVRRLDQGGLRVRGITPCG